jgi:mannose-6-phosphate isomerase-like protein (cupin superfamily)
MMAAHGKPAVAPARYSPTEPADMDMQRRRKPARARGRGGLVFEHFAGNPTIFEDDDVCAVGFSGNRIKTETGTTFVAVASGELRLNDYLVGAGMYACMPGAVDLVAQQPCCALVATAKRYRGIFMIGGPLEDCGRLRYINGCTDTGLIQPLRCGDPCLNFLHFPAATSQDAHHHPSHRIGLVCGGEGLCHTPTSTVPLRSGGIFVLPAGTRHWFTTADAAMRIVAFHPDSEFGPTDESHQMLNATWGA